MCPIKEIIQKFAIPGHSYLPNDSDFAHIEKKIVKQQHIFTVEEIKNEIETCRVKKEAFEVVLMRSSDFFSSDRITQAITNRKQHEGHKVAWLNIRVLRVSKAKPFVMEYKYSHNEDVLFEEVSFAKRLKGVQTPLHKLALKQVHPKCMKDAKRKDMESMLPFVPPVYHTFYHEILQVAPPQTSTGIPSTQCTSREILAQDSDPSVPDGINTLQSCSADVPEYTNATDREETEDYWDSEESDVENDDPTLEEN